jgi:hypothetical protein
LTGTVANKQLANSSITINGSAVSLGGSVSLPGDIESVTATSPLTGGGSTGALTVGIQEASTSQRGSVQLSDSTSTTSSVLAATPTAVKSAYDLANDAIPKTLTTTTGDIIYASSANTPQRLGIGSTGNVLTVSAGIPSWSAPAAGGSSFSGCSLYGTDPGNFEISAGGNQLITWNQELFDVGGYHSTSSNTDRITIPSGKAGYYLINAAITFDDDNAVATCGIRIYLNGNQIATRLFIRSDNGGRTSADVQVTRNLAVGDYLQVYAYTETAQGAYHYAPDARFEVIFVGSA